MRVIFATYNSLPTVADAVEKDIDLILFDEAHRTSGSKISYYTMGHYDDCSQHTYDKCDLTVVAKNKSKQHINPHIKATKRLYMTATPRIYAESTKRDKPEIISMDDENIFGQNLYILPFSEAVDREILVPFKIILPELSEEEYNRLVEVSDDETTNMNDLTKMHGVWKAITHPDGKDEPTRLLQKAIIFHNSVNKSKIFAGEKGSQVSI